MQHLERSLDRLTVNRSLAWKVCGISFGLMSLLSFIASANDYDVPKVLTDIVFFIIFPLFIISLIVAIVMEIMRADVGNKIRARDKDAAWAQAVAANPNVDRNEWEEDQLAQAYANFPQNYPGVAGVFALKACFNSLARHDGVPERFQVREELRIKSTNKVNWDTRGVIVGGLIAGPIGAVIGGKKTSSNHETFYIVEKVCPNCLLTAEFPTPVCEHCQHKFAGDAARWLRELVAKQNNALGRTGQ